ncbi:MAG: hypothetical protein COU11_03855 [Candidatus Harrisonbacteria bacterium CG10_big_fil_rev_8_21_14_0_10_49_15]|uniref:DoxX family protein n=1 Tax=Candidatus Harrisonbacteria bacterium CG10_big_fil_rev_8_21_14_0_10_49_15 TaxID=1974587 RepID=A0A2H0UK85_9BACT|nr:MAG: hypothetical protein COU11_03855 [Candidatus Harrisonbacteria bacterium CG10_big_fil_rev_8_21_14_0_10_49_15]
MKNIKVAEWVLRIAVAGEFLGHGVFALQQKAGWLKYFSAVGIDNELAMTLMPIIGIVDIALAIWVLWRPNKTILTWMFIWALWTAFLRPLGGDPIWDFVERFSNWGAPLALLFIMYPGLLSGRRK